MNEATLHSHVHVFNHMNYCPLSFLQVLTDRLHLLEISAKVLFLMVNLVKVRAVNPFVNGHFTPEYIGL